MTHALIYLHGFLSSPRHSEKARLLREGALAAGMRFSAPDLNLAPAAAAARALECWEVMRHRRPGDRLTIVGSSLGGFYAGRLANIVRARVVLLNPCLEPWGFVAHETGVRRISGTDREVVVEPRFARELFELNERVPAVPKNPAETFAILSTRDEVLDWRSARRALGGAAILEVEDDHRISGFDALVGRVLDFARRDQGARVRFRAQ